MSGWLSPAAGVSSETRLRLFCLPYAGGGAGVFRAWRDLLGPAVDVRGVCLPGRESRFTEPRYRKMDELVDDLVKALDEHVTGLPYALFGHSLGALVAYELAARLAVPSVRLIVSGSRAPRFAGTERRLSDLPDGALVRALTELGGMPPGVLAETELLETMLPMVRDDLALADDYRPAPRPPLSCPVTALCGDADGSAPPWSMTAWKEVTTGPFTLRVLPGEHFFVHDDRIVHEVRQSL
ncbi:thioesterase II family protein [Nonomuraea sp. NPDC050556]|uniref:thioesterase II family protein n=1 Tax=Nonomuraea sp. NPDC050556 TaxID=3364369 RepID=UPI0037A21885